MKELVAAIYKSLCDFLGFAILGIVMALLPAAYGGLVVFLALILPTSHFQHRGSGNLFQLPNPSWGLWALWGLATAVALGVLVSRYGGRRVQEVLTAWHKNPNDPAVQAVFEDARRKFDERRERSGNVTQTRKHQLRPVSPFENMPDVWFVSVVAVVSGIGAFMLHGILRWTAVGAFSLVLLYIGFRLSFRLFPKYMRLHDPLAVRYVDLLGFHVGVAKRNGKSPFIDEDFVCRFLSDAVYQNLGRESAQDLLRETQFKATNFVDRDALLQEFVQRYPGLDCARFGAELDRFVRSQAEAPPIPGYIAEWLFADVIERRYGKAERVRYLADVVTGRVGVIVNPRTRTFEPLS